MSVYLHVFSARFTKEDNFCDCMCFYGQQSPLKMGVHLILLHSEWPKLHRVLAVLSAVGLREQIFSIKS